jgi:hypothetical protein
MHLSGKMFLKSFERSSKADLEAFLASFREFLAGQIKVRRFDFEELLKSWISQYGNISDFNHRPSGEAIDLSPETIFLVNLLWQSVRVASLMHDIGHFPFSHVFEYALDKYDGLSEKNAKDLKKQINNSICVLKEYFSHMSIPKDILTTEIQTHELMGAKIAIDCRPRNLEGNEEKNCHLVFDLATLIFLVNRPDNKSPATKILRCLHTIISSEIDADRLDYCVRDPKSSALELGAIDLKRIVDSLIMYKTNGNNFTISPDSKSISAIESFYHQRYLMYQYLIYHHNVSRMDGIVQEILLRLFSIVYESNGHEDTLAILLEFGFFTHGQPDKKEGQSCKQLFGKLDFCYYDDYWLRTLFLRIHATLVKKIKESPSEGEKDLFLMLDTFLFRNVKNIVSLWKQDLEYSETVALISKRLPRIKENDKIFKAMSALPTNLGPISVPNSWLNFCERLQKRLRKRAVILISKRTTPKIFDFVKGDRRAGSIKQSSLKIYFDDRSTMAVSDASSYLKSLIPAIERTPTFHVSFLSKEIKLKQKLQGWCREEFHQEIISYLNGEMGIE